MKSADVKLSIAKDQLAPLPVVTYSGYIRVINTEDEAKAAISSLYRAKTVGFDTETKPSFRKGRTNTVSLIQISDGECCYLFRINKFGFAKCLVDFMQDPSVTKIGLSLRDDFHVLHRLSPFEPQSFVDLQTFVSDYCITDASLQKIFAIIFGQRISKSQRLSNWEADSLSEQQQSYASIDAWACLKIYNHLTGGYFDPRRSPYVVHTAENESENIISPQK